VKYVLLRVRCSCKITLCFHSITERSQTMLILVLCNICSLACVETCSTQCRLVCCANRQQSQQQDEAATNDFGPVLVGYLRHTAAARVVDQRGYCDAATRDAAAGLLKLAHRTSSKFQYGQRRVRQLVLQEPTVRDFCGCCKREATTSAAATTATAVAASDTAAPLLCMQQLEQWSTQELSECFSAADAAEHLFCNHKCSNRSGKLLV
jgi:hypothetical protein